MKRAYGEYETGNNPKRKFTQQNENENSGGEVRKDVDKLEDYLQSLVAEKTQLDQKLSNATRLIEEEINKVKNIGRIPVREHKYVNVYREKPVKVVARVLVPIREHPKFNFVGKILGPKGNTLKRLQEETMCRMSVLGKGSMKNAELEEMCKESGDPKYDHLNGDLHVEISAYGPPAEAHARMAFALAEVRKYLIPDRNDLIRQEQLREMESMGGPGPAGPRNSFGGGPPPPMGNGPPMMRPGNRPPPSTPRVMPAKVKIMSILDRARIAMEESYGGHDDSYESFEGPPGPPAGPFRYKENYQQQKFYGRGDGQSNFEEPGQRWKPGPPMQGRHEGARYRPSPFPRPSNEQY